MLCPNEVGCMFTRTLMPNTNGQDDLYEQTQGQFRLGDICSFKIGNPASSDLNDMMYLRTEYFYNTRGVLFKGTSLSDIT